MKKIINVYASATEEVLQHKLKDGLKANDAYCYWTKRSRYWDLAEHIQAITGPGRRERWVWKEGSAFDKNINLEIEVRLYVLVDGVERGYFVCFGANKKFTELWFHSEDWVENRG